jgi:anti-sigma B factor antagonist
MKIYTRTVGDIHILDCSGKITLGEGTMDIRNTVREVLKNGGKKIVLNLAEVRKMDLNGAEQIQLSAQTVAERGGRLFLLKADKIKNPVVQAKLASVTFWVLENRFFRKNLPC